MRKPVILIVIIAVIVAAAYAALGKRPGGVVLGKEIPTSARRVTIAEAAGLEGQEILLSGTMDEKCPTAGCWFYLKDDTGRIRVDTQFAGFNVLDRNAGARVEVYGKVIKPEDGEPEVSALGVRFR